MRLYWPTIGDRQKVSILATAVEEGNEWPMVWTYHTGAAEFGPASSAIIAPRSTTHYSMQRLDSRRSTEPDSGEQLS